MVGEIADPGAEDLEFISNEYQLLERAGEGTFSTVYKAREIGKYGTGRFVAIKAITRTSSPRRIVEELNFLKKIGGTNNVVKLIACHRSEDQICAVFPYFEPTDFKELLRHCTLQDIKSYVYNLLVAVNQVHAHRIIHRDIKPSNFLYNKEARRGVLIDFGLAQHEREDIKDDAAGGEDAADSAKPSLLFFNSVISKITQPPGYYVGDARPQMRAQRAGTRGFRAPEVLFRSTKQRKSIDIWSAGVTFLIMCTRQYPFFNSADDTDAIVEIAAIFGHTEMREAAKLCERIWKSNIPTIPNSRIPFEKLVCSLNPDLYLPPEGYDLLYRMLDLVPARRISASGALQHPFFADIR